MEYKSAFQKVTQYNIILQGQETKHIDSLQKSGNTYWVLTTFLI
jgi:hypothetical protein